MQRVKPKMSRAKAIAVLIAAIAVVALAIWGVSALLNRDTASGASAALLPCPYSEDIYAFGTNVLYYDGMSIHCMSATGAVRWSFQIGADAGLHCTDDTIVAWVGSTVYILDENGHSSYNDNLGETIQFARVGKQYIAAVIGKSDQPRLLVKDHTGAHMDEESDAYQQLILLDVGFYGRNGEYMWTLALDVYGTAANTILNTFEVGKMNTGETSLGEHITYEVVYENGMLRVISTRKMRTFTDRGNEDTAKSVLVYGWHFLDSETPERGDAMMLFAPTSQAENMFDLRELRVLCGQTDKRYTLPDTCIGAGIYNRSIYAVSDHHLYRAGLGDHKFTMFDLPMEEKATQYIDNLSNGRAIIACGEKVYVVTLPQGSPLSAERR